MTQQAITVEPTRNLERHQIEFFQHNGFLALDRITTDDEVNWLREIYDRLFTEKIGWDEGIQFDLGGKDREGEKPKLPQLMNPSKYVPELRQTTYFANAQAIARQILGEDIMEHHVEHMIFKPATYGAATPWHQDQGYHSGTHRYRNINFWLPLDDATIDSGCMQFVPGSHRKDLLPHHSINNDPAINGFEVDEPEKHSPYSVACPLPAGGCTMHASYTLHYTGPNTSSNPRRAYTLVFLTAPTERDTPIDTYWRSNRHTAAMSRAKSTQQSR